jgi:adenylate cyclase class IV
METEARARIEDIEAFRRVFNDLGAKKCREYSCKDHVFALKGWDLNRQVLKVRSKGDSSELVYGRYDWQDGIKKQVRGFKAKVECSAEALMDMVKEWGFEQRCVFDKRGEAITASGYEFVIEKIDHIGWMLEFEGTLDEINQFFCEFGLKKVEKSIPKLVEEALSKQ